MSTLLTSMSTMLTSHSEGKKIDVNIVDIDGGILGKISVLVESGKKL